MKITIVYDNEVYKKDLGLKAGWSFSCLVKIENTPKILFDTGANGLILLSNMKKKLMPFVARNIPQTLQIPF